MNRKKQRKGKGRATTLCVTTLPWFRTLEGLTSEIITLSLCISLWAVLCGRSLGVSLRRRFSVPSAPLGSRYAAVIAATPVAGHVSEAPGQFWRRTPGRRAPSLFV